MFQAIFQHFKRMDWILIISSLFIAAIGLFSIYGFSLAKNDFLIFQKQVGFLIAGFILMFVLSFFDWRAFRENPFLILGLYLFCLAALAGLFLFASPIRGVKSWYKIGDFSFDPIWFTVLVLLILLAKYFSMRHIEMYRLIHILLSGFYLSLPAFLIFFQPNLGPVLILTALWLGILVVSGIKLRHFLILLLFGLLILVLSWSFLLRDYQKERIIAFLSPQIEPLGISWSQSQAKIAIGSGGIWGKGIADNSQAKYGFLPESRTDFIFAAIAEQFGLMAVFILIFLFLIIFWRLIKAALSGQSNFPRFFATGFAIFLASQAFIHIGMNLGLLPVIGIPLPLVSYGGSSLIAIFIGLGLIQSIKTH